MKEWFKNSTAFEKFCAVAFVFLAILSCLATAQSVCLTLGFDKIPYWITFVLAFILVFMIYALTSYLLVKMVNSMNGKYCQKHNLKLSERRVTFIGCLLGVILLWGICSFPTNTHSMVYVKEANRVATAELDKQKEVFDSKLKLTDDDIRRKYSLIKEQFFTGFNSLVSQFNKEATHPGRPGVGEKAIGYLSQIESYCEKSPGYFIKDGIDNLPNDKAVEFIGKQINTLREERELKYQKDCEEEIKYYKSENSKLKDLISNISKAKENLKKGVISINEARNVIDDGYNYNTDIKNEILDKVELLKDRDKGHIPENVKQYISYRIERMYSVRNVWGDFFDGKLPKEFDMLNWIIWSIILDIAAFLFSCIAFRGKTHN